MLVRLKVAVADLEEVEEQGHCHAHVNEWTAHLGWLIAEHLSKRNHWRNSQRFVY